MPGEYKNMKSVSVYIEKEYVNYIDSLASTLDMKRSTLIAELIKDSLRRR